jgi:spore maturation protein CgeB
MINETVILLTPSNRPEPRLSKHIASYLATTVPSDLYFYKPLQEIFSKVIAYDYTKQMTEIGVKGVNKEIIALVRKEHPKYVLWISGSYEFRESTLDIIRQEGSIVVGLFGDDETRFDDYSKWWIPHLDYFVTNDIEAVPKYRTLNARCILAIPIGGGIPVNRDWSNIEEKYDVSFVGNRVYGGRERYINELKNRNIPIHLPGEGRGRRVPFEEMIDIFGASKINLNFSRAGHSNKMQFKGRIFEVCLAGGFLLTEYVPGIEGYFEIDKEIVCFHNAEEMIDKITYYLNHEEERRAIAQAGWERSHMVSKVFRQIAEDISAKGKKTQPEEPKMKMPMRIRKRFSDYYLKWGIAFSMENHKGLWKDALALSILYYPFNIRAWYHYILGFLPYSVRLSLIRLYRRLLS